MDACSVCLERRCNVSSEDCGHEFCTKCALYLCATNTTVHATGPAGSITCPLCRKPIISFTKLSGTTPARENHRTSLSLTLCTAFPSVCSEQRDNSSPVVAKLTKPDLNCTKFPQLGSSSFRSLSCMGAAETSPCLVTCTARPRLPRSASHGESSSRRSWYLFD